MDLDDPGSSLVSVPIFLEALGKLLHLFVPWFPNGRKNTTDNCPGHVTQLLWGSDGRVYLECHPLNSLGYNEHKAQKFELESLLKENNWKETKCIQHLLWSWLMLGIIDVYINVYVKIYMYMYTHICTYVHTHTHFHIFTAILWGRCYLILVREVEWLTQHCTLPSGLVGTQSQVRLPPKLLLFTWHLLLH